MPAIGTNLINRIDIFDGMPLIGPQIVHKAKINLMTNVCLLNYSTTKNNFELALNAFVAGGRWGNMIVEIYSSYTRSNYWTTF
jgi:hypothetical protein